MFKISPQNNPETIRLFFPFSDYELVANRIKREFDCNEFFQQLIEEHEIEEHEIEEQKQRLTDVVQPFLEQPNNGVKRKI